MTLYRYSVRYRRVEPSERVYRVTVTARNADDARRMAAIADPGFGSTTQTPRRMGEVLPPEGADGLTSAKARELLEEEGTVYFNGLPTDHPYRGRVPGERVEGTVVTALGRL